MPNIIPGLIYVCNSFRHIAFECKVLKTYSHRKHGHCAQVQVTRVQRIKTKHIKPGMVLGVTVDTLEEVADA